MVRLSSIVSRKPNETLVLSLVVKNEADIILDNIFFHYSKGVDYIIVTDNGSTDGTLEILQDLEEDGLIYLNIDKVYNQDRLVNRMGEMRRKNIMQPFSYMLTLMSFGIL
jgi:hypothetical protein